MIAYILLWDLQRYVYYQESSPITSIWSVFTMLVLFVDFLLESAGTSGIVRSQPNYHLFVFVSHTFRAENSKLISLLMESEKRPANNVEIENAEKRVHVNCFAILCANDA